MTISIQPEYEYLRDFIENLPKRTDDFGEVIRNNRNILRKISVENTTLVVKQYKIPRTINRFIYTFFYNNKARRSYEYAEKLERMGIATAAPIAYIEIRKKGLFHTGYFISEYIPHPVLDEVVTHPDKERILDDFACFTARLHEKGVVNRDYNAGNILFRKQDEGYEFALIDINRILFRAYSRKKCLDSLKTLGLPIEMLIRMMKRYTEIRGKNPDIWCGTLLIKRGVDLSRRQLKRRIKGICSPTKHRRNDNVAK